jgi:hypothetical protein
VSNKGELAPYRSLFPWRCYFIDFEYAIQISPDATADEMAVAAEPIEIYYIRWLAAPEVMGPERYNPFPADVYQLGNVLWEAFHVRPECEDI